jgi:hypothetical protein
MEHLCVYTHVELTIILVYVERCRLNICEDRQLGKVGLYTFWQRTIGEQFMRNTMNRELGISISTSFGCISGGNSETIF